MEAGLKQNKIEARSAVSWSFKIITESLLEGGTEISNSALREP